MLFCYGVVLNQAPFDFGWLIGAYVATFFVVGQVINLPPDHRRRCCHYAMGSPGLRGPGRVSNG
jgi:hypothetical protein